jgi:hypothetical protein
MSDIQQFFAQSRKTIVQSMSSDLARKFFQFCGLSLRPQEIFGWSDIPWFLGRGPER